MVVVEDLESSFKAFEWLGLTPAAQAFREVLWEHCGGNLMRKLSAGFDEKCCSVGVNYPQGSIDFWKISIPLWNQHLFLNTWLEFGAVCDFGLWLLGWGCRARAKTCSGACQLGAGAAGTESLPPANTLPGCWGSSRGIHDNSPDISVWTFQHEHFTYDQLHDTSQHTFWWFPFGQRTSGALDSVTAPHARDCPLPGVND